MFINLRHLIKIGFHYSEVFIKTERSFNDNGINSCSQIELEFSLNVDGIFLSVRFCPRTAAVRLSCMLWDIHAVILSDHCSKMLRYLPCIHVFDLLSCSNTAEGYAAHASHISFPNKFIYLLIMTYEMQTIREHWQKLVADLGKLYKTSVQRLAITIEKAISRDQDHIVSIRETF